MASGKMIFVLMPLFIILSFIMITDAYIHVIPQKFGQKFCTDKFGNRHNKGDVWYDQEKCEQHSCLLQFGSYKVQAYGCAILEAPEDCKLVRGTSNYPYCCPSIEC